MLLLHPREQKKTLTLIFFKSQRRFYQITTPLPTKLKISNMYIVLTIRRDFVFFKLVFVLTMIEIHETFKIIYYHLTYPMLLDQRKLKNKYIAINNHLFLQLLCYPPFHFCHNHHLEHLNDIHHQNFADKDILALHDQKCRKCCKSRNAFSSCLVSVPTTHIFFSLQF